LDRDGYRGNRHRPRAGAKESAMDDLQAATSPEAGAAPAAAPGSNAATGAAASDAPGSDAGDYQPVTLTPKAADMVRITREQEGMDPSQGLRVAVRGGGCSGFEYALDFETEARSNDYVYDQHGLKLYVDAVSARYLEGTTVDYVLGMNGAGFKFINPKAAGTCGCGSSFTV
jgi:iron-sulfur cluster assembly accessory protein